MWHSFEMRLILIWDNVARAPGRAKHKSSMSQVICQVKNPARTWRVRADVICLRYCKRSRLVIYNLYYWKGLNQLGEYRLAVGSLIQTTQHLIRDAVGILPAIRGNSVLPHRTNSVRVS